MKVINLTELRNNMEATTPENLPEDFHTAISMDEAISRVERGMREVFINKKREITDESS